MKNKVLAAVATSTIALALLAPLAFAVDQYLPDVSNLQAEALPESVKLSWDAVQGADSYTIYYGTQSISQDGASYEQDILVGDVTTYTVENLDAGVEYFFAAAADDSTGVYLGSYNYSEEVSAIPEIAPVADDPIVDPVISTDPVSPTTTESGTDPFAGFVDAPAELETVDDPMDILNQMNQPSSELEMLMQNESEHMAATEPSQTVNSLPQSGPATAVVALMSAAGAYAWRKFRK